MDQHMPLVRMSLDGRHCYLSDRDFLGTRLDEAIADADYTLYHGTAE
jgi:hypothetical protein